MKLDVASDDDGYRQIDEQSLEPRFLEGILGFWQSLRSRVWDSSQ